MDISKLSKCGILRYYQNENIICIEGNPGQTAYLLLKGSAVVYIGSFRDKGKAVATIPVGTIFGEMSLLENNPRSATVVAAQDDTVALEIGKDNFLQLMQTDPELAFNLLRTLATRIERTLDDNKRFLVAYNAEVHRNPMYLQISKLDIDQFREIVEKNGEYALQLLKYLSHTLADINKKVMDVSR